MESIVFGLATAFVFAVGMITSARCSRLLTPRVVVGSAATMGLIMALPFAIATGIPPNLNVTNATLMLVTGAGNILGLICVNAALRVGKVGVVSPIVATQGAVAVIIALLIGRSLAPLIAALLSVIVLGIVISARTKDPVPIENERPLRSVLLASLGALFFGAALVTVGVLSTELPLSWLLIPGRLVGTIVLTVPLLLTGKLRITRKAAPLLLLLAVCDLVGITLYAIGAELNIQITAVMSSQMAPIAAVLAFFLFKEKLVRGQLVGLIVIIAGVIGLSLVQ
ncbi:MAG: EamA family transporter [Actinomycetales bacterium]|nr:EamA family transporter [Actinomycetales bacterium]